jgi:hypothetical protein
MRTRRLVAADLTRKHWSEKTATRVLTAWRESAMSLSAFARGKGLNAERLRWWRKRIEAGTSETAASVASLAFIPATVSGLARVTVRLPGGVEVEGDIAAIPTGWVVALARELGKA